MTDSDKNMHPPVAIVGIGELGGVFARAFLRAGYPVYPVTRDMPLNQALDRIPPPALTLIAVGENDLPGALRELAPGQRTSVGLLQNELLQEAVTTATFSRDDLMRGVVAGIEGDPEHKCMGRSARARLSRFIAMADKAGLAARAVRAIQEEIGADPA